MGDVAAMKGVWHTVRLAQKPWKENFMVHRGTLSMGDGYTGDDGQEDYVGDDADIDTEPGLTAVSWRADVTKSDANLQ